MDVHEFLPDIEAALLHDEQQTYPTFVGGQYQL